MPISTRLPKSIPSTCSRKPCTKCCRDCSPSVTMSMPASSCIFSARSVASRFPASSSAPASRHCGHSRFGSASHDGFGRLPAMLVGNIRCLDLRSGPRATNVPAIAQEQYGARPTRQGASARHVRASDGHRRALRRKRWAPSTRCTMYKMLARISTKAGSGRLYLMKVLVVEDDAKTGAHIKQSLDEHGHVTDLASNGRDGLFLATGATY